MERWSRRPRAGIIGSVAVVAAVLVAACGSNPGPRPTDPRAILSNAIAATAGMSTARFHADVSATMGALGGPANAVVSMAFDADVNIATRELAGRAVIQMPPELFGGGAVAPQQQTADVIVTQAATFTRSSFGGRWQKVPTAGLAAGPTNAQLAQLVSNLLSNPAVGLEVKESSACSLGTCDHVLVHVDGQALGPALGPLLGIPVNANIGAQLPTFDIDVLVDQATSVVSELHSEFAAQGTSARVSVVLTNPGQPIQLNLPPASEVDDLGIDLGPPPVLVPAVPAGPTPPPIAVPEESFPTP